MVHRDDRVVGTPNTWTALRSPNPTVAAALPNRSLILIQTASGDAAVPLDPGSNTLPG